VSQDQATAGAPPAADLFAAWQAAQAEWLRAWTDWASPSSAASAAGQGAAPPGDGAGDPDVGSRYDTSDATSPDPFAMWQRLARQALERATAGADPLVRDVSHRLLDAQQMSLRVAGVMAHAWRSMAAGQGGDPASAFTAWAEQLRQSAVGAPEQAAAAADDMAAQWRAYLEALQRTVGPWAEAFTSAPDRVGRAAAGDRTQLGEIMRLNWDAWERSVGRIVESPSLGFTRELDEKVIDGFETWVAYRRAVGEYQMVLGQAWADAAEAMAHALLERAEAGKPVGSLRDLGTLWTEVADGVLEAAFRSEGYAQVQGRMVTAAMRYRMAERTLVGTFLKMTDIPSRTELDEAFQEIYALRRELRALRRELGVRRDFERPGSAVAPAPGRPAEGGERP